MTRLPLSAKSAISNWQSLGGRDLFQQFNSDEEIRSSLHPFPTSWLKLLRELETHSAFTNAADPRMAAYWASSQERHLEKNRKAVAAARQRRLRRGEKDDRFNERLLEQAKIRQDELKRLCNLPNRPRRLRNLDSKGIKFTCAAWVAKVDLEFAGNKVNPSSVARRLVKHFGKNHNTLRDRTERDLIRVDFLEKLHHSSGGKEGWAPFDPYGD
ncbi:hypothetical protein ACSMXM_03890 [Pacificimonas sp. ICDLI1SI03]